MENQSVEKRDDGYWVAGSRVSLDSVVFAFLAGLSLKAIATECFPVLTFEQVFGAITYYLAHRVQVDEYLKSTDEEFESLRQATRDADPQFHAKLIKARREALMGEV